jgi:hypothetical protein
LSTLKHAFVDLGELRLLRRQSLPHFGQRSLALLSISSDQLRLLPKHFDTLLTLGGKHLPLDAFGLQLRSALLAID